MPACGADPVNGWYMEDTRVRKVVRFTSPGPREREAQARARALAAAETARIMERERLEAEAEERRKAAEQERLREAEALEAALCQQRAAELTLRRAHKECLLRELAVEEAKARLETQKKRDRERELAAAKEKTAKELEYLALRATLEKSIIEAEGNAGADVEKKARRTQPRGGGGSGREPEEAEGRAGGWDGFDNMMIDDRESLFVYGRPGLGDGRASPERVMKTAGPARIATTYATLDGNPPLGTARMSPLPPGRDRTYYPGLGEFPSRIGTRREPKLATDTKGLRGWGLGVELNRLGETEAAIWADGRRRGVTTERWETSLVQEEDELDGFRRYREVYRSGREFL